MRLWLSLLITALFSLALPFHVNAQTGLELDSATISIWPEYDKPDVLVIYRMVLSSKASLPAEVSIHIPKAIGKPSAVAMQDVDGSLVNLNYTTTAEGDWVKVVFTTPAPDFQIEYYDPRMTRDGTARNYEYRWAGDYTVNALSIEVQQPKGATNMQITPNLGAGQQRQDGLTYFGTNIGQLKAGTGFSIKLSYNKSTNDLTVNSQPVQSSAPINQNTPGRLTFQEILPWVLAAVGLLLVAGGGLWYWQSGRERRPVEVKHRHTSVRARENATEVDNSVAVYCHQCGRRASPGDEFCRTCGTKLKI